nr:hypothetical protein [Brevundimonas naejangsanensis]
MTEGKASIVLNVGLLHPRQVGKSTFWHSILGPEDRLDEIKDAPDRVLAIIGAAIAERHLTAILRRSFVADEKQNEQAFKPEGPLGTFMAKARLGYLMGLYSDDVRNDLAMIARIRNAFAHIDQPLTFDSEEVARHCRALRTPDKWTFKTYSGGFPGDGVLMASHDPSGRLHSVRIDFNERDERVSECRWRLEAAVQLVSYALAHCNPLQPGHAIP